MERTVMERGFEGPVQVQERDRLRDRIIYGTEQIQQQKFIVYYDQEDRLYIAEQLAYRFGLSEGKPRIEIMGEHHVQVSMKNIKDIIATTNGQLIPEYRPCTLKSSKTTLTVEEKDGYNTNYSSNGIIKNNYFTFFEDLENKDIYIPRGIYEQCLKYNIKVDGSPKIIQGQNCYKIGERELEEFALKSKYIGQRQSLLKEKRRMNLNVYNIKDDMYIPMGMYSKYEDPADKKQIKIDGVFYVKVNEDDIAKTKLNYLKDDVELNLVSKTAKPKNKLPERNEFPIDHEISKAASTVVGIKYSTEPVETEFIRNSYLASHLKDERDLQNKAELKDMMKPEYDNDINPDDYKK